MVVKRGDEDVGFALTYGLLNSTFLAIYAIILDNASFLLPGIPQRIVPHFVYAGIALGAAANGYLQYELRVKPSTHMMSSSVSIDPSTPFSNMINLQDEIFSKMGGHLRVIDKHFNSAALTNL